MNVRQVVLFFAAAVALTQAAGASAHEGEDLA